MSADHPRAHVRVAPQFDLLRATMLLLHFGVIAYVCWGWHAQSRIDLFIYVQSLPLIMLQWILNRGSSFVSNLESLIRNGRWRDRQNPFEGRLFQQLFRVIGLDFTRAQINTLVVLAMTLFWIEGMFRMVMAE